MKHTNVPDELLTWLNSQPELLEKLNRLQQMEADGLDTNIDRIELDILELVKSIGAASFGRCIDGKEASAVELAKAQSDCRVHSKKKLNFTSLLGKVQSHERVLRQGNHTFRPLADLLGLRPGGLTRNLQRAVVDFGADKAFARASVRIRRHHNISLSATTIRKTTLEHAHAIKDQQYAHGGVGALPAEGAEHIIAQIDGTMLPVVVTEKGDDGNARKHRTCQWKEVKLCAAYEHGKTQTFYAIGADDVTHTGFAWARAVLLAGWAMNTRIHGLGDGARWIYLQYLQMFGSSPGAYLLDFFHVCEYLCAAQKAGAGTHKRWLEVQKNRLLTNHPERILATLEPYAEAPQTPDEDAPVRSAIRYLSKRSDQLDYQYAVENELPIGSGMIEGGHRHVLQNRLKISGAWWKQDNLTAMAHLCVCRVNEHEDQYWNELSKAA